MTARAPSALDSSLLDNPVWHALQGPHLPFREGSHLAARYDPAVAIFCGLPDEPTQQNWAELAALMGPDDIAAFLQGSVAEPDGWERVLHLDGTQMVATAVVGRVDSEVVDLGPGDVTEMVALVQQTDPGPFGTRTVELGGYVGLRDESGALVAMAGHRLRVSGFVEVSAVCTADSERGKGLASRLVRHVVANAAARDDTVFLHAVSTNVGAIRLYESLGFSHRREIAAVGLRRP